MATKRNRRSTSFYNWKRTGFSNQITFKTNVRGLRKFTSYPSLKQMLRHANFHKYQSRLPENNFLRILRRRSHVALVAVANTILFEHKKRAHHANAKVVGRGCSRGKTIYLHRRNYEQCVVNKICRRLSVEGRRCLGTPPSLRAEHTLKQINSDAYN